MYRQYEDPHKLENRLVELMEMLAENPEDEELAQDIAEIKERINFAWQDDEYESEGI